jgi:hypothetical protein
VFCRPCLLYSFPLVVAHWFHFVLFSPFYSTLYIKYSWWNRIFARAAFPSFFFARDPFLASKNNHVSSHPCSRKYRVSGWYLPRIKNLYLCIWELIINMLCLQSVFFRLIQEINRIINCHYLVSLQLHRAFRRVTWLVHQPMHTLKLFILELLESRVSSSITHNTHSQPHS